MEDNVRITVEDILKNNNELKQEDYYSLAGNVYDAFDVAAYNKGKGYACQAFPVFNEKLEGLEEGLFIFAAQSNVGKSAFMSNMVWDYSANPENKLFAIYISLDDSANEIIPRLIAMNRRIPISVGSKPRRYEEYILEHEEDEDPVVIERCTQYKQYLEERKAGLQELKDANKRFLIVDRDTVQDLDMIMDYVRKVQQYVKTFDPENNVIVAIDSLADVAVKGKFGSEREKIDHVVSTIKHFANNEIKAPIFASYHLRKLNRAGRPGMDDLKESGKIGYEASCVFLLYNDVSLNKEGASVFLTDPEVNYKLPVIELDAAKNKKSSFKGRIYYAFSPEHSKIVECPKDMFARFDALIYSK